MKVALTGHRSEFFLDKDRSFIPKIERSLKNILEELKPELVISGGCQGFDLIGAKQSYVTNTPFDLYLPFPEFGCNWELKHIEFLEDLKPKARNIKNVSPSYHKGCFYKRDMAMIDDCDIVVSLLNPEVTKGGTFYTVKYAESNRKEVFNIWPEYDDKFNELLETHKLFGEYIY